MREVEKDYSVEEKMRELELGITSQATTRPPLKRTAGSKSHIV